MCKLIEILKEINNDFDSSKLSTSDGLNHPLTYLLYTDDLYIDSSNHRKQVCRNTELSLQLICNNDKSFFNKAKINSLFGNDRDNASAILGEIRCYGALLTIFNNSQVKHVNETKKSKTPDFLLDVCEQKIKIEVATLQMNNDEALSLSKFEKSKNSFSYDKIIINEHISRPFGNKKSSGTTPSVIYKLRSVKKEAMQLSTDVPRVLWIDCQDEQVSQISSRLEKDGPLYSSKGIGSSVQGLRSNEIWYSLYAHINDLILDGECLDRNEGNPLTLVKMKIDGRFYDNVSKRISGVIFYGPNAMCLYENPFAYKPLPECFRIKIMECQFFKYENSRINFPKGQLKRKLHDDAKTLKLLRNKTFYSW